MNSPNGSENASGRTTPVYVKETNIRTDDNSKDGRTVAAQLFPKALALSVDSLDRGQAKKTKKQFTRTIRERKLATGKPIWVLLLQEQNLVFVGTKLMSASIWLDALLARIQPR